MKFHFLLSRLVNLKKINDIQYWPQREEINTPPKIGGGVRRCIKYSSGVFGNSNKTFTLKQTSKNVFKGVYCSIVWNNKC